jgi:thioredoxin 1
MKRGNFMADGIKKITEESFHKEIETGLTLVDFFADWCGPCRMLTPILEKLVKEVEGKATIAKLDIDKAQKIAAHFQVTSVPTLILFKDGKEVGRIVGLRDHDAVKSFILKEGKV